MNLKQKLTAVLSEVLREAETNSAFRARLHAALEMEDTKPRPTASESKKDAVTATASKRPANRRPPAVLDPVVLARTGEEALRTALARLDLEQLRDVVADFGMDPGNLVMKWKDADKVRARIVEIARSRAQKGNAFLDPGTPDSEKPR